MCLTHPAHMLQSFIAMLTSIQANKMMTMTMKCHYLRCIRNIPRYKSIQRIYEPHILVFFTKHLFLQQYSYVSAIFFVAHNLCVTACVHAAVNDKWASPTYHKVQQNILLTSVLLYATSSSRCFPCTSSDFDGTWWLLGLCFGKRWRTSVRCFGCVRRLLCTLSTCRRNVAHCAGVSGTSRRWLLSTIATLAVETSHISIVQAAWSI